MPTIPLHISKPPSSSSSTTTTTIPPNPLPPLLHTPSGLALLELQGTIHFPPPSPTTISSSSSTLVGKLVFPFYNPDINGEEDTKWMKRVYFYVGENQRLSGEVRKLGRPFAMIRKREGRDGEEGEDVRIEDGEEEGGEELEIVEVVRYKVVFSTRPEPVSVSAED